MDPKLSKHLAKLIQKASKMVPKPSKMMSQSRLGNNWGYGRPKSKRATGILEVWARFWGPFWRPKSIKIMIFRHRFLNAFLGCIFNGFERRLDLILEAFGGQTETKTQRRQM